MIRLRDVRGVVQSLSDDTRFVEVCDLEGAVALLLYRDDAGVVKLVRAGSPEADRYARMMGTKFISISSQ